MNYFICFHCFELNPIHGIVYPKFRLWAYSKDQKCPNCGKYGNKILKDVLPREAVISAEFQDCKFQSYLGYGVLEEIKEYDPRFPFKHKHIFVWWILENNMAVGFNKNPSRGWSFPVMKLKEQKNNG